MIVLRDRGIINRVHSSHSAIEPHGERQSFSDYRDAVVFVETEVQNSDGTNRKFSSGTGFIIAATGYVITAADRVCQSPRPDDNK